MNPLTYIIILNWNNHKDTIECVESAMDLDYENFRVLMVDNGSTDNSAAIFKEKFPEMEILENGENFGFAKGNNKGIEYALAEGAEYIFILNNDTVVAKDMLSKLVSSVSSKEAILSPKVYYYDNRHVINSLGTTINWFRLRPNLGFCGEEDKGQFNAVTNARILIGCALFMSRELLEKIKCFDEDFYMIHEDADLSLRNLSMGGQNIVIPEAVIYHKASSTLQKYPTLSAYYSVRNLLYLAHKNASIIDRVKVFCGLTILIAKNGCRFLFDRSRRKEAIGFFWGVADYFFGKMGKSTRNLKI